MNLGVVVVGKVPEPGGVKTRLCPPLTPQAAAALYTAFLEDTLALSHRFAAGCAPGSAVYLLHPNGAGELAPFARSGTRLLAQSGDGLGDALAGAFDQIAARGHAAAVVIGSDLPHMPLANLRAAAAALDRHDVVLGPAEDGGYYLIAGRRRYQPLFEGVAWSTAVVLEQTLQRAAAAGVSAGLIAPWWDVDTASELVRLARHLAAADATVAPRTRAVLARLTAEGLRA
jgi:rSAM/selenodomain-associated transferase 1